MTEAAISSLITPKPKKPTAKPPSSSFAMYNLDHMLLPGDSSLRDLSVSGIQNPCPLEPPTPNPYRISDSLTFLEAPKIPTHHGFGPLSTSCAGLQSDRVPFHQLKTAQTSNTTSSRSRSSASGRPVTSSPTLSSPSNYLDTTTFNDANSQVGRMTPAQLPKTSLLCWMSPTATIRSMASIGL